MKKTFMALANENRLRIVLILLRGPLNVSEISSVLHLGQSNVSHYLKQLLDGGLVRRNSGGGWVYYSLDRSDPFRSMLIEAVSEGRSSIESHPSDMAALARCYSARRDESREFFGRIATDWESRSSMIPVPAEYMESIRALLPDSGTVLDAGCGSGELLGLLSGSGYSLIGVDQSPEMLSEAGKRLAGEPSRSRIELRLGTAEHLPVADSSVDGVVAHMVLHHLGEPSVFFREASRVLTPGGVCITVELHPHDDSSLKRLHGDLWPGLQREDVQDWMQRAGFTDTVIKDLNGGRFYILSGKLGEI